MFKSVRIAAISIAVLLLIGIGILLNADDQKSAATNNSVGAALQVARSGACAANLKDGSVLITGGHGANGSLPDAEVFNAKSGSKSVASMAYPRESHACAALSDGRVLVAGGSTLGGGDFNTAEIFDPATGKWTTAGSMSAAR